MPIKTSLSPTYRLKAACNNCGMRSFYNVPIGAEFWPMDSETGLPRSYDPSYFEYEDESRKDAKCDNCHMPCLTVEYWELEKNNVRSRKVAKNG